MRQHALAAVAIFALSYSAYGADLPVKASEAPASYGWTGYYAEHISIIRPVNLAGRKLVSARPAPQANSFLPRDMISHPEQAVTQ